MATTDRWLEYERLKAQWIASHQEATSAEYQAAMRSIAERLGL